MESVFLLCLFTWKRCFSCVSSHGIGVSLVSLHMEAVFLLCLFTWKRIFLNALQQQNTNIHVQQLLLSLNLVEMYAETIAQEGVDGSVLNGNRIGVVAVEYTTVSQSTANAPTSLSALGKFVPPTGCRATVSCRSSKRLCANAHLLISKRSCHPSHQSCSTFGD